MNPLVTVTLDMRLKLQDIETDGLILYRLKAFGPFLKTKIYNFNILSNYEEAYNQVSRSYYKRYSITQNLNGI